jgi:hypothetical protein
MMKHLYIGAALIALCCFIAPEPAHAQEGGGVVFIPPITPGNLASWSATNVLKDSGVPASSVGPQPVSTRQVLTATTASTYTTPPGCRQIKVRMVGGGAGGGCWNGTENGGNGATSTFKDVTCLGGVGGGFGNSTPTIGAGGAAGGAASSGSNGTGVTGVVRAAGGDGFSGTQVGTGGAGGTNGASGGGSAFGGGSGSIARASNCWGAGGAGAFTNGAAGQGGAGGGGAGEYAEFIINGPAATYPYQVGAAGPGTTTGSINGSAGRQGIIIVDEFY